MPFNFGDMAIISISVVFQVKEVTNVGNNNVQHGPVNFSIILLFLSKSSQ